MLSISTYSLNDHKPILELNGKPAIVKRNELNLEKPISGSLQQTKTEKLRLTDRDANKSRLRGSSTCGRLDEVNIQKNF